jgi:ABC-2 type transport system permease protein
MYWSQLCTILWLRWRLTRNQWSHGGQLNAAISIVVTVLLTIIGAAGGFIGLAVGLFFLATVSPEVILGVWDGTIIAFLALWIVGILSEIQRSEAIDIGKMLHLPVSLMGIFIVNYVASHVTSCIIVFVPWMMGLSIGLAVSRGWAMLLLVPLVLGFVLMITAWTYLLRGWLVMLMQNPRRYRAIVGGITLAFILLSQLPNLLIDAGDKHRSTPPAKQVQPQTQNEPPIQRHHSIESHPTVLLLHSVVPVLWVGNGAMHLASGGTWPAVLGAAGAFGLAGLGLGRAYRSTRRFYEGRSIKAKTRKKKQVVVTGRTLLERTLPGMPDEAAALALATFRSMTRATEVKMAMASNLMWLVIFGGMLFFRRSGPPGAGAQPFIATAAVVLPFLGMAQLLLNHFGFDRAGFRALVLSPVPRWQILLGKNLALLPFTMSIGLIFLLIAKLALHIPWLVVLAASLQSVTAFLLLSMFGNLISPLLPCRIAPGALRPTKLPAFSNILLILCHASFSATLAPIFLPAAAGWLFASAGWLPAAPTNLLFSAIELALFAALYSLSLPHLGKLLQHREKEILRIVTQEVE